MVKVELKEGRYSMMEYDGMCSMDERLRCFLEGKSVAIVGPSPHLQGTDSGKKIDNYDVVVRVNYFQTPTDKKVDYGSRTDLMFHNFGTPWMGALKDLIKTHPEDFDCVKFLACPVIRGKHSDNIFNWSDDHISDVVENSDSINKNGVPFYWIGIPEYRRIYNEVGCEPYSGPIAISILLSYPIKELLITGFTFYIGAKTVSDIYFDSYKAEKHQHKMPAHGGNATEKSFRYFLELYSANKDRIIVDDVLLDIIGDNI
jgi:hypothetical protein